MITINSKHNEKVKTQTVKIMSDGQSSEVSLEAETHEAAVQQVVENFQKKNETGKMMSEKVIIFSKGGSIVREITNILCE